MTDRTCEHQQDGECVPCFQARIRSVSFGAGAFPSRRTRRPMDGKPPAEREARNSWEKGEAVNTTRQMPYLDENGNRVPVKKFAESRRRWRDQETITVN